MDVTKLSREKFEKALSEYGLSVSECFIEKGATWVAYHEGIEYFPYEAADGSIEIEPQITQRSIDQLD